MRNIFYCLIIAYLWSHIMHIIYWQKITGCTSSDTAQSRIHLYTIKFSFCLFFFFLFFTGNCSNEESQLIRYWELEGTQMVIDSSCWLYAGQLKSQILCLRTFSKWVLNSSRLSAMTTAMGRLLQCPSPLSMKKLFLILNLILSWGRFVPLQKALNSHDWVQYQ